MSLLEVLRTEPGVIAAELRPPRAELGSTEGMDAWIDLYHAIRALTRQDLRVFLTDSAVGTQEENNLRHLVANLGRDVPRERVVPFLTSKHSLEFCLTYAEQAWQHGFSSLVVLGGDKSVGRPRCVEHAWELRKAIREHEPHLTLGGWANPHADARKQVDFLVDEEFTAEYYLTQIVSHLNIAPVERFVEEARRRGADRLPGMFGVFYYRSANPKTLRLLSQFLPVPIEGLEAEFAAGASPVDVCARTLRAMMDLGVRHFYISNLPLLDAAPTLNAILEKAGVTAPTAPARSRRQAPT
jgi:5,10-methylenetetrahydrofolate reductase